MNVRIYIPFLLSLAIASFYCFWNLGLKPFGHHDESIHANAVYTMYATGDYLHPKFNNSPYLNKPPLKMWLTALTMEIFGPTNFAFRIWDGIAGIGTAALVFFFTSQMFGGSQLAGLLAVLLLMSSRIYLFSHVVRHGTQDSMLVFLISLAMCLFWRLFTQMNQVANSKIARQSALIGLVVGCAVLTKSVAGFFALIVISIFLIAQDPRALLSKTLISKTLTRYLLVLLPMSIVSVTIAAMWYLPQYLLSSHIDVEAISELERFQKGFHNNGKIFLYLQSIKRDGAIQFYTWVCSSIWLCALLTYKNELRQKALFLATWGLGILTIVSILSSRVPHYMAPAFPAFAIAGAGFIYTLYQSSIPRLRSCKNWMRGIGVFQILLCLFLLYQISIRLYYNAVLVCSEAMSFNYGQVVAYVNNLVKDANDDGGIKTLFLTHPENPRTFNTNAYGNMLYSQILAGEKSISYSVKEAEEFLLKNANHGIVVAESPYAKELADFHPQEFTCFKFRFHSNDVRTRYGVLLVNFQIKDRPSYLQACNVRFPVERKNR